MLDIIRIKAVHLVLILLALQFPPVNMRFQSLVEVHHAFDCDTDCQNQEDDGDDGENSKGVTSGIVVAGT